MITGKKTGQTGKVGNKHNHKNLEKWAWLVPMLTNVEIMNDIINARINATITSRVEEFTASFEERMNATLDEEIETINATLSAIDAKADKRIVSTSAAVDAVNVKIVHATDKHLRHDQPGKTYINLQSHAMDVYIAFIMTLLSYAVKAMLHISPYLVVHSDILN